MWNENDRKWLYETMSSNGVDTGSYEEFANSLNNKEDRDWYYNKSLDLGLDVGSAEDFYGMMVQPQQPKGGENGYTLTEDELNLDEEEPKKSRVRQKWEALKDDGNEEEEGDSGAIINPLTPEKVDDHDYGWNAKHQKQQSKKQQKVAANQQTEAVERARTKFGSLDDASKVKTLESLFGKPINEIEQDFFAATDRRVNGDYDLLFTWATGGNLKANELNMEHLVDKSTIAGKSGYTPAQIEAGLADDDTTMKYMADKQMAELEEGLDSIEAEIKAKAGEAQANWEKEKPAGWDMVMALSTTDQRGMTSADAVRDAMSINGIPTEEAQEVARQLDMINYTRQNIAKAKNLQALAQAEGGGGKQFVAGMGAAILDPDTWTSAEEIKRGQALQGVLDKINDEGEGSLTQAEQKFLESVVMLTAYNEMYAEDVSASAGAGKSFMENIPFMFEMAINPLRGTGKAAGKKLLKWAEKRFRSNVLKKGTQVLGNIAGSVAAGYGTAATMQLPGTIAGVQERMQGDVVVDTDEDGKLVYGGQKNEKGAATAVYEEFTERMLDTASEMIGAGYASLPFRQLRKWGKGTKVLGWIDNLANSRFGKTLGNFFERTGWHGPIEEFMEEVHVGLLSPALLKDPKLKDFFNEKDLTTTLIAVAVPGAITSSLRTAVGAYDGSFKLGAQEKWKMQSADRTARTLWGENIEQWNKIKSSLDNGSIENTEDTLSEVDRTIKAIYADNTLTNEQKKAALEYAVYSLQYKTATGVRDAMTVERKDALDDMFHEIYGTSFTERVSPAQANKSYKAFQTATAKAEKVLGLNGLSVEEWMNGRGVAEAADGNAKVAEVLTEYLSAKMDFEGKRDRFIHDRDRAYRESDMLVDDYSNNGMIYTTRIDNQDVYITGGNVVLHEDGVINWLESSEELYVRMPDGKVLPIAPMKLIDKVVAVSAESVKLEERAKIDANFKAEFDAAEVQEDQTASGSPVKTASNSADAFTLVDNGIAHTVEVVAPNNDGMTTSIMLDGEQKIIPNDLLNTWREAAGVSQTENGNVKAESATSGDVVSPVETTQPIEQPGLSNGLSNETAQTETAQPQVVAPKVAEVTDFFRMDGKNYAVVSRNEDGSVTVDVDGKRAVLPAETNFTAAVPTDKGGKVLFTEMPAEKTLEYFVQRVPNSQARAQMIENNRKQAESALKKYDKEPNVGTDPDAYEATMNKWEADKKAAQAKVDYWNEVAKRDAEISQSEMRESVEAVKPREVVEMTPDEFVANQLGGIKITPESFQKETGTKAEQKQMVGVIAGKENGGVSIERAAEIIYESYGDELRGLGFNGDMQDVRDMIIDVLSNGNLRSFARKGLEMRQQTDVEQQLAELRGVANALNFESIEEQIAYEESIVPRIMQELKGFDETEYFNNLAENYENDTTRESENTRGSSELLQSKQSADNAGVADLAEPGQGGEVQGDVYSGGENAAPQGNQQVNGSEIPNNLNRDNLSLVEVKAERGEKGQKAVEPTGETDNSTVSQVSDLVSDLVAEGEVKTESGEVKTENAPSEAEIKEPTFAEEVLENGDKRITNYNSRGEVEAVSTERDGKIISVDSYDDGVLFETTTYDGNGVSTSVTRYDKSGNVVAKQEFKQKAELQQGMIELDRENPAFERATENVRKKLEATGVKVKVLTKEEAESELARIENAQRQVVNSRMSKLDKVSRAIMNWLKNNTRNRRFEIELPAATQRKIRKEMGRDYDTHSITANEIAHSKKNHGVNGIKNTSNSIPLRDEDFALIPYIMTSPSYVERGSFSTDGSESIRFYKTLSNGYVVVVEKEQKNSPDDMATISMWAELSANVPNARNMRPSNSTSKPATVANNTGAGTVIISPDDVAKIRKDAENAILFDTKVEKMVYGGANSNQEVFVSNARKAVEEIKQEKATPQQWLAMIKKNGGLKAGEEAWLGLEEWLTEKGKVKGENGKVEPVTKQEILDFIGENKIQIEEVNYQGSEEDLNDSRGLIAKMRGEDFADEFLKAFDIEYGEFGIYDEEKAYELYKRENGTEAADEEEILAWAEGVMNEAQDNARPINSTRLEYTTEGLDNKREIALTVQTVEPYNASDEVHFGDAGNGRAVAWVRFGETTADTDETIAAKKAVNDYLAEMREKYNTLEGEETDAMTAEEIKHLQELTAKEMESGEKKARVLVIDEIQSKRHQDGREKGYKNPNAEAELEKVEDAYREAIKAERDYDAELKGKYGYDSFEGSLFQRTEQFVNSLTEEEKAKRNELKAKKNELAADYYALLNGTKGVPVAPFEKNWHELAMKRMLRLAAEEGFDKVAWTTGEQQAERYNIGAVLKGLKAYKTSANEYYVIPYNNGAIGEFVKEYTEQELADTFGKELAQKIITNAENATEENPYEIEGEELRVGGEGMKGFYDRMLPSFVSKYTKKWGAKVGTVEMPNLSENNTMHSVDVTPEMKESVMEGQTMFLRTSDGTTYGWAVNGEIYLTPEGLNPNTPIHEYTHLWAAALQKSNPKLWSEVVEAMKLSPAWNEVMADENYTDIHGDDNRVASEVLSRLSGNEGYRRYMEQAEAEIAAERNIGEKVRKKGALNFFKRIWNKFRNWLQSVFKSGKVKAGDGTEAKAEPWDVFVNKSLKDFDEGMNPDAKDSPLDWMFIGKKGAENLDKAEEATTRLDNLNVAREMETAGKDAKAIKLATGWERGADGKWRYETEDVKLNRAAELFSLENHESYPIAESLDKGRVDFNGTIKLADLVNDEELLKAYPEMEEYFVSFEKMDADTKGLHDFANQMIRINKDNIHSLESTLVHEIQHAIQYIEGFAKGSNPEQFREPSFYEVSSESIHDMYNIRREADELIKDGKYRYLRSAIKNVFEEYRQRGWLSPKTIEAFELNVEGEDWGVNSFVSTTMSYSADELNDYSINEDWRNKDMYMRTAGEVESRNVQERMGMSPEERRNKLAEETEDVRREDQIFLYDNLGVSASEVAEGSIDDVKTQPLTFEEQITESLLNVSAENKENFALRASALRQLGQDLANVTKLMSKQREYDKSTVNQLVKLAKMYFKNAQLMGEVSTYAVGRVLAVINNVVGKKDIMANATKLMDILLESHSNSLEGILEKAEKVKAKKVNAAGVEVMGSLDVYAQETVDTYKAHKDWDAEELSNAVSSSLDDLGEAEEKVRAALKLKPTDDVAGVVEGYETQEDSADDAVKNYKTARAIYKGMLLAEEYRENVHQAKKTINTLKKELIKAQGTMSKAAMHEFVKSTNETIMETRIELIDALHNLIYKFTEDVQGGRARAKAFVQAQVDRAREIQHNANSDMEGISADVQGKKSTKWNNSLMRGVMSSTPTFQTMLMKFGEKAVDGKGYLYERFVPQATMASEKEFRGQLAARVLIDTKLKELYGKKADIAKFAKDLNRSGINLRYTENGVEKTFDLTKGQMLYIYMANKMSDGKMKLRKMGITEEVVANIQEELPDAMVKFADWVQDELLADLRERYNKVHERMFGAPMAAIENYFPLKIKKEARGEKGDVSQQDTDNKPSTMTGSIIKRTKNSTALDLSADALAVLLEHIDQMEHWAAYAEFNRDLNTLLNYRHFQNQVKNMSSVRYGSGDTLWKNFQKVAQIASGTYQSRPQNEWDRAVLNFSKGIATSKIAFRGYTALKQLLSAPAFWNEAGITELAHCYGNPMGSWNWALENLPGFKKRWEGQTAGNEKFLKSESDWKLWHTKAVEKATEWGMKPNAFVDAVTVAVGARAVYETKLKQFKEAGYTVEKATQKALQAANEAYNESQQSSEGVYLSPIQADSTAASAAVTTFKNSNFGFTRKTLQAAANLKRKSQKGYKESSIEFMKKKLMRDGLSEEQAEKYAKKLYKKSFYKDVADLALFGFGLNLLWELGGAAIYLFLGDDDDEKEKMIVEAGWRTATGVLAGMPGGDLLADVLKASLTGEWDYVRLPMLVAAGDIESFIETMRYDKVKAANDFVNMLVAAGVHVNPQTLTDVLVALFDGDGWDAEEIGLFAMRFLNAPQSQLDKLEVDKAMENSARDLTEVMKRYVEYKHNKATPLTGWMYSDENEQKALERYAKRFDKLLDERFDDVIAGDAATFDTFYNNATPKKKEDLADKRKAFLNKGKEKEFVKLSLDDIVNNVTHGETRNEVYSEYSTAEDIDSEIIINQKRTELKPVYDALLELPYSEKAAYRKENEKDIILYEKLKKKYSEINKLKKEMKDYPEGDNLERMNKIREKMRTALDLINNNEYE